MKGLENREEEKILGLKEHLWQKALETETRIKQSHQKIIDGDLSQWQEIDRLVRILNSLGLQLRKVDYEGVANRINNIARRLLEIEKKDTPDNPQIEQVIAEDFCLRCFREGYLGW